MSVKRKIVFFEPYRRRRERVALVQLIREADEAAERYVLASGYPSMAAILDEICPLGDGPEVA